jgi:hypothetical protein
MGFCCGAGMIGSFGSIRHYKTLVHNVPILFCPICNRLDVHPAVEGEYEILIEYAQSDGASEVDFKEYVHVDHSLFENCAMTDEGDYGDVLTRQIDMALDLLGVAKLLRDEEWQEELKDRLHALSKRLRKYKIRPEKKRSA